uniref:chitinase n=1 Tax=Hirondellea gigas TaxID=1518452 RepID=A0A2P2HWG6_9CRUS
MAPRATIYAAAAFILAVVLLVAGTSSQHSKSPPVVACYLGSWAVYRPSLGQFTVEDIDPTLCTHVIYAFAGLNETTNRIMSLDPAYDIEKGAFKRVVALKERNPRLKVIIAIGGWTEGSAKYSKMADSSQTRKMFIDSTIAFIREHKFDGLDLDWEYPASRGGKPHDKKNFVQLCKELRTVCNHFGWVLTAAVGAGKSTVDTAYDLPALSKELDYLHLMAYDYHGKWDGVTGHNAPLYARDDEPEEQRVLNVEFSVDYYLKKGVPPRKLVLGLGLYGRTFLLTDPANPAIAAPAQSTAFAGPYTREDGFLGYNEICKKQVSEPGLWRVVWQKAHQAPYMFRQNMWVSYDDDNSVGLKVAFAQSRNLAGVMVWSIDTDDFRGSCGAGKFPLLVAINKALGKQVETTVRPIISPEVRPPPQPVPGVPLPPLTPSDIPTFIDHDVEGDNTIDGSSRSHSTTGAPDSSDGTSLTSFQSFAMFALFILAMQYLFGHAL